MTQDIEQLARALDRGLGETWFYCCHGSYLNGYEDYPSWLKAILRNGVKAILTKLELAPDALPCGHPRSAATGNVTQWCTMCEEEANDGH